MPVVPHSPSENPRLHTVMDSPVGPITLVATPTGLAEVRLEASDSKGRPDGLPAPDLSQAPDLARAPELVGVVELLRAAREQLGEYFRGERMSFEVPLDLPGARFHRRVLSALLAVPYGTTTTYGRIAEHVGSPGAARAVGGACARNPLCIVVPCHRVVGAKGALTGYVAGPARKKYLLELERQYA